MARRILLTEDLFYLGTDGLLYHLDNKNKRNSWKPISQLVIPESIKFEILVNAHDHITAGHFGTHKTYQKVKTRYWWKGMLKDVQHWCESCTDCAMRKTPKTNLKMPLLPIPVEGAFDRVAIDVLGPLPVTTQGNRYILVFSDYLTRWPEAFAIPNMESSTVARIFIDEIISRHGAPRTLLSDRGTNFLSSLIAEVCKLFDIHKLNTSSYHPQTDGLVERFNSTLLQSLSMYVDKDQKDWDLFIPSVLFGYRASPSAATQETPFFLLYGRECRLPIDVKLLPPSDLSTSVLEHRKRIVENIERSQNIARENIQKAQQKMKMHYDKRAKKRDFEIGQSVWVYTPKVKKGLSKKLMHLWHGPYRIAEKLSPVHFYLRTKDNRRVKFAVHANRIKPYVDPNDRPIQPPDQDDVTEPYLDPSDIPNDSFGHTITANEEHTVQTNSQSSKERENENTNQSANTSDNDDNVFNAEKILKERKRKGQTQFLIKWANYPKSQSTWEPEENILDERLITNFRQKSTSKAQLKKQQSKS